MSEFGWIKQYFKPLTMGQTEALNLSDDGAILSVPGGYDLVVSSDTFNEGIHILPDQAPETIARKALRVNLSDLAAMGAKPYAYQLNLALPKHTDEPWIKNFTSGLAEDQKRYNIFCSGGDTTQTKGPLSLSITIFGLVPKGGAIKRSSAKSGNLLMVTGTIGDAYIGLQSALKNIELENNSYFAERMLNPSPRLEISEQLQMYVDAAIDISDGLLVDVGHIVQTSNVGLDINVKSIPFSAQAEPLLEKQIVTIESLVGGGDDYELALAVQPQNEEALKVACEKRGIQITTIGRFTSDHKDVRILSESGEMESLKQTGWSHF